MHHEQELVGLERDFVFNDTVLGDAHAIESRAYGTQPSDYHSTLERSHDPSKHRASHQPWTDTRNGKKRRPEQQSPEPSPKCAGFAPTLHPVTGVVVAHRLF